MFLSLRTLLVTLMLCGLLDIVHAGWRADSSCDLFIDDIRPAMSSALGNSKAVVALQKNPYFLKVAGYLMPLISVFNAVSRHANIVQYYSEELSPTMNILFGNDVIVYCDLSRFETKAVRISGKLQVVHYDKVRNVDWPYGEYAELAWQGCSGLGFPGFVFAASLAFGGDKPDQIQLCPWYLKWLTLQKFKDSTSVKPDWLTDLPPETEQVLTSRAKTKMDLRTGMLLDIKLSHELTHLTRAGQSIDVDSGDGVYADGWNYCIENAIQGFRVAENLAMLGAAANMIQEDEVMPDLAGNIVPLSLDARREKRAGFVGKGG